MNKVNYGDLLHPPVAKGNNVEPTMETSTMTKFIGMSKTIWVNVTVTAVSLITAFQNLDWVQDNPQLVAGLGAALGILNVLLRLVTNKPLSLKK